MMNRKLIFWIILSGILSRAYSQDSRSGIWSSFSLEKDICETIKAGLEGSVRKYSNESKPGQYFIGGTASYSFNEMFSASASYRLIWKLEDDNNYYYRHKVYFDLAAKYPYREFDFSARLRFQRGIRTYIEDEEDLLPGYYGRIRIKSLWNSPVAFPDPFLSAETYSPVNKDEGFRISKFRLTGGAEIRISNRLILKPAYIFQKNYYSGTENEHIMSVECSLDF